MAVAREAEPVNSLSEVKEAGLDREDLLATYRNMVLTRGIEERGHILYKQGKIPGSFYTGRGNEAAAVGGGTAMGPNDVGTPLHRDMGVHVTRSVQPRRNFAGVRQLPVVFVCDNNQWAYSTPTYLSYPVEHIADRAASYGFDGVVVDGTDVLAVYREAKRAIEKARDGGGPTLLECQTLRMEGHAVHDDAFYVPKEMFEAWAERDPLERFRTWLRDNADLTAEEEDELRGRVKKILNDALSRADESPLPDPSTLLQGVYATAEY